MGVSSNRITGLATGLDIDSIIEASLANQKNKITKKTQAKEILEIKQQLYRDIISEGKKLYDKHFDIAKSGSLLSSSVYSSVKCTSNNEYSITATSGAEGVKGNYKVTVNTAGTKSKIELTSADFEADKDINININGTNIFIDREQINAATSDKEKAKLINNAIKNYGLSAYTTDYDDGKIIIETNDFSSNTEFSISQGTYVEEKFAESSAGVTTENSNGYSVSTLNIDDLLSDSAEDMEFNYGDKFIRIRASDIKSVVSKIDKSIKEVEDDTSLDAEAKETKIEELNKEKSNAVKNFISNKLSSAKLSVDFEKDDDGNIADYSKINIQVLENDTLTDEDKSFTYSYGTVEDEHLENITSNINAVEGTKASVTVEGPRGTKTITDAGSKFTLDGITFDISGAKAGDSVVISAKTDITEAKEKIVDFVNDFNTFIEKLNTLLTEKKYRNYAPLTEDQKKEMTDKEIELWNGKVKSGLLRNDSDLSRIANNLKNAMVNTVSGVSNYLENIGIKTTSDYGGTKSGTFTIDEEKLTAALENDMEDVMNLFIKKPEASVSDSEKYNNQGIAQRLKDIFYTEFQSASSSNLIKKAGYTGTRYFTQNTISTDISKYETLIDQLEDQLKEKEQNLYSKWATIETTMNNYNSQMNYLSSMFGGAS